MKGISEVLPGWLPLNSILMLHRKIQISRTTEWKWYLQERLEGREQELRLALLAIRNQRNRIAAEWSKKFLLKSKGLHRLFPAKNLDSRKPKSSCNDKRQKSANHYSSQSKWSPRGAPFCWWFVLPVKEEPHSALSREAGLRERRTCGTISISRSIFRLQRYYSSPKPMIQAINTKFLKYAKIRISEETQRIRSISKKRLRSLVNARDLKPESSVPVNQRKIQRKWSIWRIWTVFNDPSIANCFQPKADEYHYEIGTFSILD